MAKISKNEDDYIDPTTPNEDLNDFSQKALIWYDKNHSNSFKVYARLSFPKLLLYLMALGGIVGFCLFVGQKIKDHIHSNIVPITKEREKMLEDLSPYKEK